jgi:hypothetical protein
MKTETKMMKVIADYGRVLRGFGVQNPTFLLTNESYKAITNPDGLEFDEDSWVPCHALNEDLRNFPGAVGMYDGVFLVRAYNVNQKIAAQNIRESTAHLTTAVG